MDKTIGTFSVFFDEPFYVGILEIINKGKLSVCKITFGAAPKDWEIYDFVLKHYAKLTLSPSVEAAVRELPKNPKRLQRDAQKQTRTVGIGTKSQQALKLQQEAMKTERRQSGKAKKEAEKQRIFALKQQKRKEKHCGR